LKKNGIKGNIVYITKGWNGETKGQQQSVDLYRLHRVPENLTKRKPLPRHLKDFFISIKDELDDKLIEAMGLDSERVYASLIVNLCQYLLFTSE
jgi:DNA segregation ATPase FtsK/SpoIIIE-like protein